MTAGPENPAYGLLRPVTETASVLLCNNPGPMTLDGTNTWVLLEPGATAAVVVDPGPLDEAHLAAVLDHVAARLGLPSLGAHRRRERRSGRHGLEAP